MKKMLWHNLFLRKIGLKRKSNFYAPLSARAQESIKSILLLAGCGLGDAVCYLPTLITIRKAYPEARIVLVVASNAAAQIVQETRLGIEIIVFNRGMKHNLLLAIRLLLEIRKRRIDIVLSDAKTNSYRIPLAAFFSGAIRRIGSSSERLHFLYNWEVDVPDNAHVLDKKMLFLRGAGLQKSICESEPKLHPPIDCKVPASSLLIKEGIHDKEQLVGMTFGGDRLRHGNWDPMLKQWHVEGYAEVARWLINKAKVRVAIFGEKENTVQAEEAAKISGVGIVNMCGKTSIGELQWLLKRCTVLITNDTGTMHLAAALEVPMVALFGPTSPNNFGPKSEIHRIIQGEAQCSPCFPHPNCNQRFCLAMHSISSSQIIDCLKGLLHFSSNKYF